MKFDGDTVVAKMIELMGGKAKSFAHMEHEYAQSTKVWDLNIEHIGRILRAHLFVEHFLREYVAKRNPRLGGVNEARLSFPQLLGLVGSADSGVADLLPGIRRLNAVRNRLAHQLDAKVTREDAATFLAIDQFRAMKNLAHNRESTEPIDVLEDFAKHTGVMLQVSVSKSNRAWVRALRLVHPTIRFSE